MRNMECLVEARFGIGESPVWDGANNRLLWSDNTTDEIHAIGIGSRRRQVWHFGDLIGSCGLARRGRLCDHAPEDGAPDGGATDLAGTYWSAGFSAQCFNRVAPDGTLLENFPFRPRRRCPVLAAAT